MPRVDDDKSRAQLLRDLGSKCLLRICGSGFRKHKFRGQRRAHLVLYRVESHSDVWLLGVAEMHKSDVERVREIFTLDIVIELEDVIKFINQTFTGPTLDQMRAALDKEAAWEWAQQIA